jgi:hypothetical protein
MLSDLRKDQTIEMFVKTLGNRFGDNKAELDRFWEIVILNRDLMKQLVMIMTGLMHSLEIGNWILILLLLHVT